MQQKAIRIMTGTKTRISCNSNITNINYTKLIYTKLHENFDKIFDYFTNNSSFHNINTRRRLFLHKPVANLTVKRMKSILHV
jgi:hypothetical protein